MHHSALLCIKFIICQLSQVPNDLTCNLDKKKIYPSDLHEVFFRLWNGAFKAEAAL